MKNEFRTMYLEDAMKEAKSEGFIKITNKDRTENYLLIYQGIQEDKKRGRNE